jgi:NTP pyrophosphatase (non-canonical NTP hydrolase)
LDAVTELIELFEQGAQLNPTTQLVNVAELAHALDSFANERDWAQFHSPKNLVMALTGEVGELNELFQWLTEQQSKDLANDPQGRKRVAEELADVLFYLVRTASVMGIDLNQAAVEKLAINEQKYPAGKARGSSKKYSEL